MLLWARRHILRNMPAKPNITQAQFDSLLGWLDADRERASEKYEAIRRRLIHIFTARGSHSAEDLADETINRVARRARELSEDYRGDPSPYFYGVAKRVYVEYLKQRSYRPLLPDPPQYQPTETETQIEYECLQRCLQQLAPEIREFILRYYGAANYGEDKKAKIESRQQLANDLGVNLHALRLRAHRVRSALRKCVNDCTTGGAHARESPHALDPARRPTPPQVIGPGQQQSLTKAHEMRFLLGSLINGDWLGLHLLALLRVSPRRVEELASEVSVEAAVVLPVLTRLRQSGAAEERGGLFSCTELGAETLREIETASGVLIEP